MDPWQPAIAASDLNPGQVVEISCHGEDLLLYRSGSGELTATSAYCPHMNNYMPNGLSPGAELSQLLAGDELLCPFHGWRFDREGRCRVPAGQRVPPAVRAGRPLLRRWRVREREGVLQIGPEIRGDS